MRAIEEIQGMMGALVASTDFSFALGRVPAELDAAALNDLAQANLLGTELLQFQRIRATKRRAEFCAGRMVARTALGSWLPSGLCSKCEIGRNRSGAPSELRVPAFAAQLAAGGSPATRQTSAILYPTISHSQGIVVAVIAPVRVGIDLERIEVRPGALSRYFLSDQEQRLCGCQQTVERFRFINALWTRKEAASKVGGWGGTLAFREVDCLSSPIQIYERTIALRTLERAGYVASIAFEVCGNGNASEVSHWRDWFATGGQSIRNDPSSSFPGGMELQHG